MRSPALISAALLVLLAACGRDRNPVGPTPPCTYTLSETNRVYPSEASRGEVTVQTGAECTWTVVGADGWVTLTSPATQTGPGVATFDVRENTSLEARTKVLTVAGQPFTISQEGRAPCQFVVQPLQASFSSRGGTDEVRVTTTAACAWTAVSEASWIVVTSGAKGQGNGTVQYRVRENESTSGRTGTLRVAGETVSISQKGTSQQPQECDYSVSPTSFDLHWHGTYGGAAEIQLTTQGGCTWTARSGAGWLQLLSNGSGAGSATLRIRVDYHLGEETRRAPLEVRWPTPTAGQNVWVEQEGCRYGLSEKSVNVPASGGPGKVLVLGDPVTTSCSLGCPWSAESCVPWITITSGATGSGDDLVRYNVAANTTGEQRTGTIRIQGMTYTVVQAP